MKFDIRAAHTLSGPRVYSTDFHPRRTYDADNVQALERSLKVKLLTKGTVTLNGGHLVTPAAFEFVSKNPVLLADGFLLPAIREDKGSFGAYVADNDAAYKAAGWSSSQIDDAIAFLQESVKTVLPWRVEQAQDEYRTRLIWGVASEASILRPRLLKLQRVDEAMLAELAGNIAGADLREDSVLDNLLLALPKDARDLMTKFAGAAYHQVGTSVVNCETGLDVSELAERRLGAMAGAYEDSDQLNDVNVFVRCCFEMAMQAVNERAFPMAVIDTLPFDVIGQIRVRLQDQGFQQGYDDLISTFAAQLQQGRLEDLESWEPESTVQLIEMLSLHFRAYFDEELKGYSKAIQENRQSDAIRASMETLRSGGSAIPMISEVASVIDAVGAGAEALRAGSDAWAFRNHETANVAARRERDGRIDRALDAINPRNKAKILTALRQIRTISSEMQKPF